MAKFRITFIDAGNCPIELEDPPTHREAHSLFGATNHVVWELNFPPDAVKLTIEKVAE